MRMNQKNQTYNESKVMTTNKMIEDVARAISKQGSGEWYNEGDWNGCVDLAQAAITAMQPYVQELVGYMWHKNHCDFVTSFTKDCTCNYHEALEAAMRLRDSQVKTMTVSELWRLLMHYYTRPYSSTSKAMQSAAQAIAKLGAIRVVEEV